MPSFRRCWPTSPGVLRRDPRHVGQELYEREGKPTGGAAGFDDMAEDAAYADAVNWAASEGVMKGYSAAAFGPGDSLTREQLAVVLYRYAQKKGYELAQDGPALKDFTDGNAVSGWPWRP